MSIRQHRLRPFQRDPLGTLAAIATDQGDLAQFSLGRQRVVYLSSVALVEEAFVRQARQVGKWGRCRRWWLRRPASFVSGELFATHDDAEHARARRVFNPVFNRHRAESDATLLADVVECLCEARAEGGDEFDLTEFAQALLLAGILASFFDVRLTLEKAAAYVELRNSAKVLDARIFSSRGTELLDLARHARRSTRSANAAIELSRLVETYLSREGAARANSLPSLIERASPREPVKFAEALIASLVDAPALLLVPWLELAADPLVAAAVRAEANRGLDLERLRTCRGAALEGARLGAGWALGRLCHERLELRHIELRPGDWLLASPYLIHRDERVWQEAERFLPERWDAEQIELRPRCSFLTFGVHNRVCTGRHLVLTLLTVALAAVARRWDIEPLSPGSTVRWRAQVSGMDVEPTRPVRARLLDRTAQTTVPTHPFM